MGRLALGLLAALLALHSGLAIGQEGIGGSEAPHEATALLMRFLECEEAQEYERCYDFFSAGYKDILRKTLGIRNRLEYRRMRGFQGLRWYSPVVREARLSRDGRLVIFFVEMTFEQRIIGERISTDKAESIFALQKEKGKWVVADWKFS